MPGKGGKGSVPLPPIVTFPPMGGAPVAVAGSGAVVALDIAEVVGLRVSSRDVNTSQAGLRVQIWDLGLAASL